MDEDARRDLRERRDVKWRAERSRHSSTCRACTADLDWVLTTSDPPQWMPLDQPPTPTGTVAVVRRGAARVGVVNPGPDVDPGGARFVPHWAICVGVDAFRRRHRERRS